MKKENDVLPEDLTINDINYLDYLEEIKEEDKNKKSSKGKPGLKLNIGEDEIAIDDINSLEDLNLNLDTNSKK